MILFTSGKFTLFQPGIRGQGQSWKLGRIAAGAAQGALCFFISTEQVLG
jgi:hypothetical protein